MGKAAARVFLLPEYEKMYTSTDWWRSLLCGIRLWRRAEKSRCPDDRDDFACKVLLLSIESLESFERPLKTFVLALKREAQEHPDWTVPTEFGVVQS